MPQARPAQTFASPVSGGGRSRAESDDPFGIPMLIPPVTSSTAAPQTTVSAGSAASGGVFDWFGNSSTTTHPSASSQDDDDVLGVTVGQRQGGPAVPAMPAFPTMPSAAPTVPPGNTKPTTIPALSSSSLPPSGSNSNSNNNAFVNPFGNSGANGGSDDDYDPFANFGTNGGASARPTRSDSAAAMEKFRKMYDLPPTDTQDGLGTPSSHERPNKGTPLFSPILRLIINHN